MIAARKDHRYAGLFRLAFGARPASSNKRIQGIPSYKLSDAMAALRAAISKKLAVRCYNLDGTPHLGAPIDGLIKVTLEEISENHTGKDLHSYTLRFSYLNPMAADRGKRSQKTGKRTFLEIKPGEDGEVGAHLLIAPPDADGANAGLSRCVLEQMSSLGRTKIVTLIEEVAETYMAPSARPACQYIEGAGKKAKVVDDTTRLRLHTFVEKSESLEDELENGALRSIRFIGKRKETDNLTLDGLEKYSQEITASVKNTFRTGKLAKALVEKARKAAAAAGLRAALEIESTDEIGPRVRRRELDLDKESLADQLVASTVPLVSEDKAFRECYDNTQPEIVALLREVLDHDEYWK